MGDKDETLADDLLVGAAAIAAFFFGDPAERRKVYSMDKEAYGLFYMGKLICGRRTTIRQRIAAREAGAHER